MPLDVRQDAGDKGIEVKTSGSEGERVQVDKDAKATANASSLADITKPGEVDNQVDDLAGEPANPKAFTGGDVNK